MLTVHWLKISSSKQFILQMEENMLQWVDKSSYSFQRWQPQWYGRKVPTRHTFIDYELKHSDPPVYYNRHRCTAALIYSSREMYWVHIPCSEYHRYSFYICEQNHHQASLNQKQLILKRSAFECPKNWINIGPLCFLKEKYFNKDETMAKLKNSQRLAYFPVKVDSKIHNNTVVQL